MMRSPIEIEMRLRGGLQTHAMLLAVVTIPLILSRKLYAPLTLMPIYDPTQPKYMTLLINYDYLPDLINEYLT